jgi:sucrose phosphorylase
VGTQNDYDGVQSSGQARRINRHKYQLDELLGRVESDQSLQHRVFQGYRKLLRTRVAQAAFHPDADQRVWNTDDPALLAFERTCPRSGQRILVAANLSGQARPLDCSTLIDQPFTRDLLSGVQLPDDGVLPLGPSQVIWATT